MSMNKAIGGERLGSGNKMNVSLHNFERSSHDLSEVFRSSMNVGTLVPFLNKVALPGDTWDINLNTPERPIVNKYCEGKVKSTPNRRVKENLKPYAYKRSEPTSWVTACLLHNEPTS